VVTAICAKLSQGDASSSASDLTGGATFTFDLCAGHPMEEELLGTLTRLRDELESTRRRLDEVNGGLSRQLDSRLVVYFGQHYKTDRGARG